MTRAALLIGRDRAVRPAALLALLSGCTQMLGETYRDPHGRFAIGHPSSFEVREEKSQAVFSRRDAPEVTVTVATAPRVEEGRLQDRSLATMRAPVRTMLRSFRGAEVLGERKAAVGGRVDEHRPLRRLRQQPPPGEIRRPRAARVKGRILRISPRAG